MRLSNTLKHFMIGIIVGAFVAFLLDCFGVGIASLFSCFVFFLGTIAYESGQNFNSLDDNYIKNKWLDILCDILAGNAGYIATIYLLIGF